jgi:dTDP-4-dehydrorhamnose 3,5-epimerase
MKITETKLKGCFFELFRKDELERQLGYAIDFVQENQSISKKGALRGLHFQKGSAVQAKLVNVTKGEVLDVVVDLRKGSDTYGKHLKIRLSDLNSYSLFIPKGMAHGFLALSEGVIFSYKCDNYFNSNKEGGILYKDPNFNIDWEYSFSKMIISEKDMNLPTFKTVQKLKKF